jgi:glycosyltransferase involved in cell wall biosynthesis
MNGKENELFFSIVIPTYNRADRISNTIDSILAQTYRNFELIIVDDGSTDNTREVIQKYLGPNVAYHWKEHDERSKARNLGTTLANGDYVNWFDSDDIMLPHHLEELNRMIIKHNRPALVGVAYEAMRDGKIFYRLNFPATILNPYMIRYNYMLTMTGIVRKDVALQFPFNTAAIPREDHELWLRIATRHELVSTNTVTVRIIEHAQSSSIVIAKSAGLYIKRLEAFIHEVSKNPAVRQLFKGKMRKFKMYRYAASAYYFASRGAKRATAKLIFKSIISHPSIFFRKDFYAVMKNFLFKYR